MVATWRLPLAVQVTPPRKLDSVQGSILMKEQLAKKVSEPVHVMAKSLTLPYLRPALDKEEETTRTANKTKTITTNKIPNQQIIHIVKHSVNGTKCVTCTLLLIMPVLDTVLSEPKFRI